MTTGQKTFDPTLRIIKRMFFDRDVLSINVVTHIFILY